MSKLCISDEVINAVLYHKKQGIIKTYNRNQYDEEKQTDLEAWERTLSSIINEAESNVISILSVRKKAA